MNFHVWIVSAFDTFVPQFIGHVVGHGWTVKPTSVITLPIRSSVFSLASTISPKM